MNRIILTVILSALFSCSTKQETKDAAFWRMKYEALESFVKRKGLKSEADKALQEHEVVQSEYNFMVSEGAYALNGKKLNLTSLKKVIKEMLGDKGQVINIVAMDNSKHQDLLTLMNELSLAGFKNFNLSTQKTIKPAP